MFPVYRVDRNRMEAIEQLGSKPKFWYSDGDRRMLFKAEERGTGEDWAEKIACELCRHLGLPHVHYELAEEYDGEVLVRPGVVCENLAPAPLSLVLGNELLLRKDPNYPVAERFHVRQHAVYAVAEVLAKLQAPPMNELAAVPRGIESASDVFVGYVMLDAWIANQDRHHENWGAVRNVVLRLAPTFDHGAGLARNITDDERRERLQTRDKNRTMLAFAGKAKSAFFADVGDTRPLGTIAAFEAFGQLAPAAKVAWLDRLSSVPLEAHAEILDEIPSTRMTQTTKQFTLELLELNKMRLLGRLGS